MNAANEQHASHPAHPTRTTTFPKTIVYPGRTAQAFVQDFQGGTLHGFSPPKGVEVLHLLAGDANLRPKEGESWEDLLGEGLAIPKGYVTISIRSADGAAHEAEVLMLVSDQAAPAAPSDGARKTLVTNKGRRVEASAAKPPKARVRRWDTPQKATLSRSQRSAQAGPERRAKGRHGPDDELDLIISLPQRQMVVDLLERKMQIPLPQVPAILHAFTNAPAPLEKPRTTAFRVPKKHLDAVVAYLQRRAPVPADSVGAVLRILHSESPLAHRPRVVGSVEARRIAEDRANGIITVEAESVSVESASDVAKAAEPSEPKALPPSVDDEELHT